MRIPLVLVILLAHFLADFVFQSDWMALNKSSQWKPLSAHVGVYTAVLALIVAFSQPDSAYPYGSLKTYGYFVAGNGAAHFVTDAVTSRVNKQLLAYGKGSHHWFFVGIGADQLIHYACLLVSASWWLS